MNNRERKRIIEVLKVLLKIDNIEIIKYTVESLIEELEESYIKHI